MNQIPWLKDVPVVTSDQMVEVDRAMMEDFHIGLLQMMENAGRCLAHLARLRFLDGDPREKQVMVLVGTGGNGGGALVAARRLHNYGAIVTVAITKPDSAFSDVPRHQLDILRRMNVPIVLAEQLVELENLALVLDGVIGYSLEGAPYGPAKVLIEWANAQPAPILSLDNPSGVDVTSGFAYEPAILAHATMTLALPKAGLLKANVETQVGELYLADISVPPALYAKPPLAQTVEPIFAKSDIVRVR